MLPDGSRINHAFAEVFRGWSRFQAFLCRHSSRNTAGPRIFEFEPVQVVLHVRLSCMRYIDILTRHELTSSPFRSCRAHGRLPVWLWSGRKSRSVRLNSGSARPRGIPRESEHPRTGHGFSVRRRNRRGATRLQINSGIGGTEIGRAASTAQEIGDFRAGAIPQKAYAVVVDLCSDIFSWRRADTAPGALAENVRAVDTLSLVWSMG